jgi:hypothetical protein
MGRPRQSLKSYRTITPAAALAAGKDFATPRPHAQRISLKWMHGTVVRDGETFFASRAGY